MAQFPNWQNQAASIQAAECNHQSDICGHLQVHLSGRVNLSLAGIVYMVFGFKTRKRGRLCYGTLIHYCLEALVEGVD